jgi:lipid-binding SYLF domain-containing protein
MRIVIACLSLCLLLLSPATTLASEKEMKLARNAIDVLREIQNVPDKRIPANLLGEAYAIAVIPEVVKAGLIFGGRHGNGLISVRGQDGTWSNPSFIEITGGSFGFQAGVQATDVILVFRTRRGVENIVYGKFTLGADAGVAAGPVGRSASASTDAEGRAEILSYSRSRGLFAGVSLDGAVLSIDRSANRRVYGSDATPRQILENRVRNVPTPIVDFRDQLEEVTAR